jgi:hypothetical protein
MTSSAASKFQAHGGEHVSCTGWSFVGPVDARISGVPRHVGIYSHPADRRPDFAGDASVHGTWHYHIALLDPQPQLPRSAFGRKLALVNEPIEKGAIVKKILHVVKFVLLATLAMGPALVPAVSLAQDQDNDKSAKQDVKDAGHSTKKAVKKTGKNIKKDTKKAVHKTAQKTAEGADKVEDKTRQ